MREYINNIRNDSMKALIAMSGGVDSSVSALIMKNRGYDCIGCTMKLHNNSSEFEQEGSCCSLKDVEDARAVANRLGMDYYVLNFQDEFKEKVIDKFVNCYLSGTTPNPCIECNASLKFGKLHDKAKELGYDYVVTGHYARITNEDGIYHLRESADISKDQSYVLYKMTQEDLASTVFPLGEMNKEETRKLAVESQLINADKKDSQDICFVPDGDYASVIENVTGRKQKEGDFVLKDGTVIGRHKGIIHYTVGQRKGLGIAWTEPLYVCKIDVEANRVILGYEKDLYEEVLEANEVNWISGKAPAEAFEGTVRTRYHGKKNPAVIYPLGQDRIRVEFKDAVRAITPGQAAVIYIDDEVIGGGVIV